MVAKNFAVRSYVLRGGRITTAQKRGLEELRGRFGVESDSAPDWDFVFGRRAPLALEIGGGYGEAAAHFGAAHPEYNYAVLEVHPPAIGALYNKLAAVKLQNVRVVRADAAEALPRMFADGALACARIFFPDPWQKKRHHKRRLVNADFLAVLAKKIAPGGFVHAATDWADYARQMRECFAAMPQFYAGNLAEAPPRPQTRFAARAEKERRTAADLFYRRGAD